MKFNFERDDGWGEIKMFREWLVMKWVYCMDDNLCYVFKKLYSRERRSIFKANIKLG